MSCRHDDIHQEINSEGDVLTIQDVKELVSSDPTQKKLNVRWAEPSQKISKKASIKSSSPSSINSSVNFEFDWDNYYVNKRVSDYPVMMVPLKNNSVNRSILKGMNPKGYRIVGFQHDMDHAVRACLFEVHPDKEYLERKMKSKKIATIEGDDYSDYKDLVSTEDFTGYTFIWSIDGEFKSAFHATNGQFDRIYDKKLNLTHTKK
ncbi:hypothetical protein OK18_00320 [Chryseobacterium gallinarum]|uniref:Uncharacterized protein n=2 Tax=Chryseobacterium gallinarum TaxID=1324352 RepID=A0A0G3M2P3_CHRGL|nr:hypothetical protein OK18_00320 [Chryseobacterium gallinarum]